MGPQDGGTGCPSADELRVRLEDIGDSGLRRETVCGPELLAAYLAGREPGFELLEPVRSEFSLRRQGREISVRGRVQTRLVLACDRCLAEVVHPVEREVNITFAPHPEVPEGAQLELSEKDLEVEFYGPEPVIDLGAVIVEELALSVPYRRLCREACQGLCPRCGADLNREKCRCEAEPTDPRLAALKDFKVD